MTTQQDPVEATVAQALQATGLRFIRGDETPPEPGLPQLLDFYLPDLDLHIECKRTHSPRSAEQLARWPNVILVQGLRAAQQFAELIQGQGGQKVSEDGIPQSKAPPTQADFLTLHVRYPAEDLFIITCDQDRGLYVAKQSLDVALAATAGAMQDLATVRVGLRT